MPDDSTTRTVPLLMSMEDYPDWKVSVRIEALRQGCDDHLYQSKSEEPEQVVLTEDASNWVQYTGARTLHAEWTKAAKRAAGLVALALGPGPRSACSDIISKETFHAWELMERLDERSQQTNTAVSVARHLRKLLGTRYEDGASIEDHIAAIRAPLNALKALDSSVSDALGATILLLSFPETPEWDVFQTPILAAVTKAAPLTFNAVESALLTRAQRNASGAESSANAAKALASTSNAKSKKSGQKPGATGAKKKWLCDFHGAGKGHNTEDCHVLKKLAQMGKLVSGSGGSTASAHRATDTDSDSNSDTDNEKAHVVLSAAAMKKFSAYLQPGASSDSGKVCDTKICDTGASTTMTPNRTWFKPATFETFDTPKRVRFGDHSYTEALGKGQIVLRTRIRGQSYELTINDVLYIPTFKLTLISVSSLDKKGFGAHFGNGSCKILKGKTCLMRGTRRAGLYYLDATAVLHATSSCPRPRTALATSDDVAEPTHEPPVEGKAMDINLLHRRMGHQSFDALRRAVAAGHIKGITKLTGKQAFCDACAVGKMKHLTFPKGRQRATKPLQLVHVDLCGPMKHPGPKGELYSMTFTDDVSGHPWTYFLRRKTEALSFYRTWRSEVTAYFQAELGTLSTLR